MPEYKFAIIHNGEASTEIIHAPNTQVANLRFMAILLEKGIVQRDILVFDKPMKSFRNLEKDFKVKKNTNLRLDLQKNINKQLMNSSRNRKRSMSSVLTDNDSGSAFNL
jgi:hypothetical protein